MVNFNIVILAGGKGKRMKSDIPKVLHKINGMSMLSIIINKSLNIKCEGKTKQIFVVVGEFKKQISEDLKKNNLLNIITLVEQKEALGTGHAVQCCYQYLDTNSLTLILFGDMPNIEVNTLDNMYDNFIDSKQNLLATTVLENPFGYGRIILDNDTIISIREEKDSNDQERKIKLVNTGLFLLKTNDLLDFIMTLDNNNKQNEYYLTDLVEIFNKNNIEIKPYNIENKNEIINVNTPEQLQQAKNLSK